KAVNKKIFGIFFERDYVQALKKNLENYKKCILYDGTFDKNIKEIAKLPRETSIFLYVDPYGVKSLGFSNFAALIRAQFFSLELLMNFNASGFLREGMRLLQVAMPSNDKEDKDYDVDNAPNTIENWNKIANGEYLRIPEYFGR
ncbi:MAG: hypothetical protein KJ923_05735, partial [Candidatus Omnitrophica bacterium]|nr:hypothetical protein [Candidatus Omnitrophota bacterium]